MQLLFFPNIILYVSVHRRVNFEKKNPTSALGSIHITKGINV